MDPGGCERCRRALPGAFRQRASAAGLAAVGPPPMPREWAKPTRDATCGSWRARDASGRMRVRPASDLPGAWRCRETLRQALLSGGAEDGAGRGVLAGRQALLLRNQVSAAGPMPKLRECAWRTRFLGRVRASAAMHPGGCERCRRALPGAFRQRASAAGLAAVGPPPMPREWAKPTRDATCGRWRAGDASARMRARAASDLPEACRCTDRAGSKRTGAGRLCQRQAVAEWWTISCPAASPAGC